MSSKGPAPDSEDHTRLIAVVVTFALRLIEVGSVDAIHDEFYIVELVCIETTSHQGPPAWYGSKIAF